MAGVEEEVEDVRLNLAPLAVRAIVPGFLALLWIGCDSLGIGGSSTSSSPVTPTNGACPSGMTLNPNNPNECMELCAAAGKIKNPLGSGCLGIELGLNWDFIADGDKGNPITPGGVEMLGGMGIGITYDNPPFCKDATEAKLTGCLTLPPTSAPIISPIVKNNPPSLDLFTKMLGIGIHQNTLSYTMYTVATSGLMNLTIDETFLNSLLGGASASFGGLDVAQFFNTETIAILWPDLKAAFPGSSIAFSLRPMLKDPKTLTYDPIRDTPTMFVGGAAPVSANTATLPADLQVRIPHLAFGVAVDIDGKGNFQNAAEVDAGMTLGIGIDIENVPSSSEFCKNPDNQDLSCCSDPTAMCAKLAIGLGFETTPNNITINTDVLDKGKSTPDAKVAELMGIIMNVAGGLIPEVGFDLSALIGPNMGVKLPTIEIGIGPTGPDNDNPALNDGGDGDFLGITIDIADKDSSTLAAPNCNRSGPPDGKPDQLCPQEIWTILSKFMCSVETKDPRTQDPMDTICTAIIPDICPGNFSGSQCDDIPSCSPFRRTYCRYGMDPADAYCTTQNPTDPNCKLLPQQEVCTGVMKADYCWAAMVDDGDTVCLDSSEKAVDKATYCALSTATQATKCPNADPDDWCIRNLCGEDQNGNGVLDAGEDTDSDGILDSPPEPRDYCPPAGDKMCGVQFCNNMCEIGCGTDAACLANCAASGVEAACAADCQTIFESACEFVCTTEKLTCDAACGGDAACLTLCKNRSTVCKGLCTKRSASVCGADFTSPLQCVKDPVIKAAPRRFAGLPPQVNIPNTLIQLQNASWGTDLNLNAVETKQAGIKTFDSIVSFMGENGAKEFAWRLDRGFWHFYSPDTFAELPPLVEGMHLLEVKSRSADKIFDPTPATLSFTVDNMGPDIRLAGKDIHSVERNHDFNVIVHDAQTAERSIRAAYTLDETDWIDIGTSRSIALRGMTDGAHALRVRAVDEAGNESIIQHAFRVGAPSAGCSQTGWGGKGKPLPTVLMLLLALGTIRIIKQRTS